MKTIDRYRRLKTELENTNYLFRHPVKKEELELLSKILSGKQLEIKFKHENIESISSQL